MNYMIKEEWICPPSFAENLKPCAGAKTFSLKDDYDCSTIASSTLSSPCQDNDEPIIGKSYTGTNNKNSNTKVTSKLSCQEEYSEEFIRQKYGEEKECLKETFDFLKTLAKHLKRGQVVVNTSMIFS